MERLVFPVLTAAAADTLAPLAARPDLEVVAVAIGVGNGASLEGLRDMALGGGAVRCHVVDAVETLAASACWPVLRAGALGVSGEPVLTALAMPKVAETLAEVCRLERATSVGVWADDPRDRQRLRALLKAVAPTLGLVSVPGHSGAVTTANLWARVEPASELACAAPAARHGHAEIQLGFERGAPVALNGLTMTPSEIVASAGTIAAAHGVGSWQMRAPEGSGTWTVHAPAARVLQTAFEALTADRFDSPTSEMATIVAERYAAVVRDGAWFSSVRAGLDGFVDRVLDPVSGDVRLRIVDGRIEVDV